MNSTDGELAGKRVLVLAGPGFEDAELLYPYYRLLEAGAEVKIAGLGDAVYKGKHGYPVTVDANVEDVVVGHWDGVVIPGGHAPDKLRMSEAVKTIVGKAMAAGNVVAAICHAGSVLVSAGVLADKKVTSYRSIKEDLQNAGATWVDDSVVVDGGLITSRTPADLPAFCRAIVNHLSKA